MKDFKKKTERIINNFAAKIMNAVSQTSVAPDAEVSKSTEEMSRLCREIAAEGIVMLKNDNGVLPLTADRAVSVFGRVQRDYSYVGYGSGGDVNAPYKVNLIDGLCANKNINLNEELAKTYENLVRRKPCKRRRLGQVAYVL